MQKACTLDFLHGPLTAASTIKLIKDAIRGYDERKFEIVFYKKDSKLLYDN